MVTNVVGTLPIGVPVLLEELGETKVLPIVTTMVYRFRETKSLRPYLGAGPIYFLPFDSEITNEVLTEIADPVLEIDDKLSLVFQGVLTIISIKTGGWRLMSNTFLFQVLKRCWSRSSLKYPVLPQYDFVRVGDAEITTDINPLVIHFGIGFDF